MVMPVVLAFSITAAMIGACLLYLSDVYRGDDQVSSGPSTEFSPRRWPRLVLLPLTG
jgi:hypothetical protein